MPSLHDNFGDSPGNKIEKFKNKNNNNKTRDNKSYNN